MTASIMRKMDIPVPKVALSSATGEGRGGWRLSALLVLALFLVGWPLLLPNPFFLTVGTLIALNAIGAASLHLIIRTGHISLAHAGFVGVGAYACVLSVMTLGLPYWVGLLMGAGASGSLALIIGPIVLRLTGKYFVLVTFLLGEIIRMVFVEWVPVTGGSNGIFGIPTAHPIVSTPHGQYYFVLAIAALCIGLCACILSSQIGRAMDAMREAEQVAECAGVPVIRLKVTIFVLACGLAGVQGGLLAHFLRYIDPTAFGWVESLNLVVMNVIGGMFHLAGPLIGTVFLVAFPEFLRGYVELQRVIFGISIIVVMAALPGGMVEIGARTRDIIAGARGRKR